MSKLRSAPRCTPPMPPVAKTGMPARRALSAYFVIVWGAGFVATRVALQYAAPFTYISVRYAIAAVIALCAAVAMRAAWPATRAEWRHVAVAGLLTHGGYLGGSHY